MRTPYRNTDDCVSAKKLEFAKVFRCLTFRACDHSGIVSILKPTKRAERSVSSSSKGKTGDRYGVTEANCIATRQYLSLDCVESALFDISVLREQRAALDSPARRTKWRSSVCRRFSASTKAVCSINASVELRFRD